MKKAADSLHNDERLLDLELMINDGLKQNNEAVQEEYLRLNDPSYVKKLLG